jgi:hypothetical protein
VGLQRHESAQNPRCPSRTARENRPAQSARRKTRAAPAPQGVLLGPMLLALLSVAYTLHRDMVA